MRGKRGFMSESSAAQILPLPGTAPDIYAYHDYRQFLRDWLQYLKSEHKMSTRQVAKTSGVSESYLSMILSGQRRLSAEQLQKLVPALRLERSEASYLEWLITIVDADTPDEQLDALKKIQRFRRYQNLNPLEIETYRYLQHWYHIAIRELAQLPGFQLDAKWIQNALRYKVSLPEIKGAIEFLIDHGFLKVDGQGRFIKPEKLIECKTGVLKPALTKFHTEMLNLAATSITEIPSEERNISAFTGAIPANQIDTAKRILNEAREKIIALAGDADHSDTVYHFGFLAFPLSNKMGDDK